MCMCYIELLVVDVASVVAVSIVNDVNDEGVVAAS